MMLKVTYFVAPSAGASACRTNIQTLLLMMLTLQLCLHRVTAAAPSVHYSSITAAQSRANQPLMSESTSGLANSIPS